SKKDLTIALKEMQADNKLVIMPLDHFEITRADREAAIDVGGDPNHIVYMKAFAAKEARYEKDLIAYHNTTEKELLNAIESGGLAMPSLAITRKDIPYEKYGPITLIGRKETIDPTGDRANRVFDSDIYSPRVPGKEWRINKKQAYILFEKFESVMDEVKEYKWGFEQEYQKGKEQFIDYADRSNAMKVAFLREQKIPIQIPKKDISLIFTFSDTKAVQEYLETSDKIATISFESKEHKQLSDIVLEGIEEYTQDRTANGARDISETYKEHLFDDKGFLGSSYLGQLEQDQKTLKGKPIEVDTYKLRDRLKNKFTKKLSGQYLEWVNNLASRVYFDPYIVIGRKKVPYTLDNIMRAMKREGLKGKEKTLTFGPAKARATAAKEISTISKMHKLKGRLVTEEAVGSAIKEQEKSQDKLTKRLINKYKHTDWRGNVDVWSALDDSMKSMADFLSGKIRTTERMQNILYKNGFRDVSNALARQAVEFADILMGTPTQYFETKLQRAVGFNEFEGIVIPSDSSLKLRKALKEIGLKVKTYKKYDSASRQKAVETFHKKPDVLFATKATKPQDTITRKDVQQILSKMKNLR
ncbi:MAG: hypothetical protein U9O53_05510, partial [archaeon]|nr:hypothetical protein [archaeon]